MTQQYVEIQLNSLAHDGRAIGRIVDNEQSQRVVFVQGGLPGQRVVAKITKTKKNFAEAVCIEVLQQSLDFISPACVHANECGGCSLQAMPYEKQLFWKQNMLMEAMQRIGKIENVPFTKIYPSPLLWGYRNKMEFAVGKNQLNGNIILGMRASASHEVVSTPNCLLIPEECKAILIKLQELMNATGFEPWQMPMEKGEDTLYGQGLWRHVVLRIPHNINKMCHIQIITAPSNAENRARIARLGEELLNANLGVLGFVHEERKSASLYAQGEYCVTDLGQNYLYENLAGVQYKLKYNSFFQVNTQAAEYLCLEAQNMAGLTGQEVLWDIYCGVGAPSLGFAKDARALYGVELNAMAINMAKQNAARLNFMHCNYTAAKAEKIIPKGKNKKTLHTTWPKPDVVIVDPPRAGMHMDVLQAIMDAQPKRIVYISCNPATLARDVALLGQAYNLKKLSAVDLFPHTAHVESCALLVSRQS